MKSEIDTKFMIEWMNDAAVHGIQTLIDVAKEEAFDNASFAIGVTGNNRALVQFSSDDGYNSVDLLDIMNAFITGKLPSNIKLQNLGRLICALDEIKGIAQSEIKRVVKIGDTVIVMPE